MRGGSGGSARCLRTIARSLSLEYGFHEHIADGRELGVGLLGVEHVGDSLRLGSGGDGGPETGGFLAAPGSWEA
jgi:hypothetical protein